MNKFNNINKRVFDVNHLLSKSSLVIQNFGNASSRSNDGFVIKPSGIDLSSSSSDEMVSVDLKGNILNGKLKPSSDEPTHRYIYANENMVNGIVHTHSKFATAFAQANVPIKNLGTTHSDFSKYNILVTDQLTQDETNNGYELNTGKKILEKLHENNINILETPGILSIRHGVFAWGVSIEDAFKNAEIIEYIAELNYLTNVINPDSKKIEEYIANKHFNRKNGPNSYYGQ